MSALAGSIGVELAVVLTAELSTGMHAAPSWCQRMILSRGVSWLTPRPRG